MSKEKFAVLLKVRAEGDSAEQDVRLSFKKDEITIGTHAESDLCLSKYRTAGLSPWHCAIERDAKGRIWVRDPGSRDGVFLNKTPISRERIQCGDTIRLGRHVEIEVIFPVEPVAPVVSDSVTVDKGHGVKHLKTTVTLDDGKEIEIEADGEHLFGLAWTEDGEPFNFHEPQRGKEHLIAEMRRLMREHEETHQLLSPVDQFVIELGRVLVAKEVESEYLAKRLEIFTKRWSPAATRPVSLPAPVAVKTETTPYSPDAYKAEQLALLPQYIQHIEAMLKKGTRTLGLVRDIPLCITSRLVDHFEQGGWHIIVRPHSVYPHLAILEFTGE